jgi:predicted SprT family Zn-dependent metalloprotease
VKGESLIKAAGRGYLEMVDLILTKPDAHVNMKDEVRGMMVLCVSHSLAHMHVHTLGMLLFFFFFFFESYNYKSID